MAKVEYDHVIGDKVIILKEGKLFNGEVWSIKIDISQDTSTPPVIKESVVYSVKHKFSAINSNATYNSRTKEDVFKSIQAALDYMGANVI